MPHSSALPVRQGVLYIAVAATAWGTCGAVAGQLYEVGLGPVSVSFWRFLTGLALLLAGHLAWRLWRPGAGTGTPLRTAVTANWRRALSTGVGLAVFQTAYFASVQQAGLTLATVVALGSGPVLVAAGARLTLGERIGVTGTVAVLGGVAGLVLLSLGADRGSGPDPLLGIGYALLAATGYAAVTLLGRAAGRHGAGGAWETTLAGFAVGTVCLLPLALLEGLFPDTGSVVWTLCLVGYLGAVPTAVAYALYFAGLGVVRATTASVVALVEPLTAAVIGVMFLDERLNAVVVAGAVVLLGAVLLLAFGARPVDGGDGGDAGAAVKAHRTG